MSQRDVAAPRPSKARDELVELAAIEAAARQRAAGIVDAEQRKRCVLAEQLVDELRRPLCESSPPRNLERIAALSPRAKPAHCSAAAARSRS